MKNVFYLLIVILIGSCTKEKVQIIPAEVQEYVDQFFIEGDKRGFDKQLEDERIIIEFGTPNNGALGQCTFRTNKIVLDANKWVTMDDYEKTWVVFHELGHCILERRHRNEKAVTGECISIMKGREDNFNCRINYYSDIWWNYYLDELFDTSTEWPTWFEEYENYDKIVLGETTISLDTISRSLDVGNIDLDPTINFSLDFEFENYGTEDLAANLYFGNIAFTSCNVCTGSNVRIYLDKFDNTLFNNNEGEFQFLADTKFTIRKIDDFLYFYINEIYVHAFEFELWSAETLISTSYFEEPIRMKLNIRAIE